MMKAGLLSLHPLHIAKPPGNMLKTKEVNCIDNFFNILEFRNMLQIFFKSSKISNTEWSKIYPQIKKIVEYYPLNLLRLESYDGFSSELDKLHTEIIVNSNLPDEHISFWGDGFTCHGNKTVEFYKEWDLQIENVLVKHKKDNDKPITWSKVSYRAFSGEPIHANGDALFYEYFNTDYVYGYALLAIGILLENLLPGKVLLVVNDIEINTITETKRWAEWILDEKFDMPVYLDRSYVLDSLIGYYKTKEELVGRMEMLYDSPFVENMTFAIEHIGYQPSLDYYSKLLADVIFGTFGFSDILQPWMKATKDLEKTLQLIEKSKNILLSDPNNENNLKKAAKYDYSYILKGMLSDYILWTPEQRERLEIFYTNRESLETRVGDLFDSLMRIGGYRIDICPIYTTETQLFETFMYFDPKNGARYRKIIDEWIAKNRDSFEKTIEKISVIESKAIEELSIDDEENDGENLQIDSRIKSFLEKYNKYERFIFEKAIRQQPYVMDVDKSINKLFRTFSDLMAKNGKGEIIDFYKKNTDEKIKYLKYSLKEKRMYLTANAYFEKWINDSNDIVLTYLYFLVNMRIYTQELHFARQQVLLNHKYWEILEKLKLIKYVT